MGMGRNHLVKTQARWIAANSVMGIICWALIAVASEFTWGLALIAVGPVVGLCMGWTQKTLLSASVPKMTSNRWLGYSISGATWGWFLVIAFYLWIIALDKTLFSDALHKIPLLPIVGIAAGGALFGFVQWLGVIGKAGAFWWTLAYAVGWGSGSALGVVISEVIVPYRDGILFTGAPNLFVAGVIATLVLNICTALLLGHLFRQIQPVELLD
jgi:hypothetical protein